MTTHLTRRLKLLSTEESHKAGNYDAETLLVAFLNVNKGDDAIVTLCELQLAVRALEPKFTESEGGEL